MTIAAFDDITGELIAQTSIGFKDLKNKECDYFIGEKHISYNPDSLKDINPIKKIFEIKGTIVNTNYNGLNLSQHLINFAVDVMKEKFNKNETMLMSEIEKNNKANLYIRKKDGFKILKEYKASDGAECYLLYKPLSKKLSEEIGFDNIIT